MNCEAKEKNREEGGDDVEDFLARFFAGVGITLLTVVMTIKFG